MDRYIRCQSGQCTALLRSRESDQGQNVRKQRNNMHAMRRSRTFFQGGPMVMLVFQGVWGIFVVIFKCKFKKQNWICKMGGGGPETPDSPLDPRMICTKIIVVHDAHNLVSSVHCLPLIVRRNPKRTYTTVLRCIPPTHNNWLNCWSLNHLKSYRNLSVHRTILTRAFRWDVTI